VAASKIDKEAFSLLSEYSKLYQVKYGSLPVINKYKEKWGMASLLEDFGGEGVRLTLNYYFKTSREGHSLPWFYNNFSSIHLSRLASEKDDKIRAAARSKTRQLRAEYLNGLS
jgi:hypothetical protein